MKRLTLVFLLFLISTVSAQTWDLNLTFVDEDNNVLLTSPNPTVTIDGNTQTISNGTLDFTVVNETSVSVQASLTNYGTRTWTFGLEKDNTNWVRTLVLLKEVDGTTVNFQLRDLNTTALLTDGNITVLHQDNNYLAGRFVIGSDSLFSTFLSPFDQNYTFVYESDTQTDFNFGRNLVKVKVPKDEDTPTTEITPYDVKMKGIGTKNVLSTSVENDFRVFPYTTDFYIADINATNYFGRNYYFRLQRADFDQNIIFQDDFTAADGIAPNINNWFTIATNADTNVDIEANDLNIFAFNNGTAAAISDKNIIFEIGDVVFFEFISNERPVISGGSEQYGGGWMPDNNVNPITADISWQIRRDSVGTLNIHHAGSTSSQLDGGTGSKTFKIRVERTGVSTYKSTFFIDDNNAMAEFTDTVAHNTWKVSLFGRGGGSQSMSGKFSMAKLFSEDPFEIQPYLALLTVARQVIIEISDNFDPTTKIENYRILSESFIEGAGLQQTETVVSDAKGQGLMSFIVGTEYTLSIFDESDNLVLQEVFVATPSSSVFSITVTVTPLFPTPEQLGIDVHVLPPGGTISITETVAVNVWFNKDVIVTDINLIIQQSDQNLYSCPDCNLVIEATPDGFMDVIENILPLSRASITNNNFLVIANVQTADGNSFFVSVRFNQPLQVAGTDLLDGIIRGQIKTDFGCTANDPSEFCWPLIMLSLFFSLIVSATVAFRAQILNINISIALFMAFLAFFVYWYWFPWQLFTGMVLFGLGITWGLYKVR